MDELVLVGLAGFLAALVDGALGMGFGPTSSSILLSTGMSPAAVSSTVNLAKVATGVASGASHWRFNNIDKRLVFSLAIPGTIGALIGTVVLTNVDGKALRPFLAMMLMVIGIRILFRFSKPLKKTLDVVGTKNQLSDEVARRGTTKVVGGAAGITNGMIGAWGPVVTPYLLQTGIPPRIVVGSVNTAEIAVALISVASLFTSMGGSGAGFGVIVAMLLGGVVAAPLSAWVVRFIPPRILGLAVSGLLLTTQSRELVRNYGGISINTAYVVIATAVLAAALRPRFMVFRPDTAPIAAAASELERSAA